MNEHVDHKVMAEDLPTCEAQVGNWVHAIRRAWQIARAVLRGYLTGQPINEERPRKGCC